MFRWYHDAAKCYVYLRDVSIRGSIKKDESSHGAWELAFHHSRWFTRGWTLQELIAPTSVEFFSVEGQRLGDNKSLEQQIHEITGITVQALQGSSLSQFSVNDRMSWAAKRETKREEDAAYSLLGIFDIHIPLIYGEGRKKALVRLHGTVKESLKEKSLALPLALFSKHEDPFKLQEGTASMSLSYLLLRDSQLTSLTVLTELTDGVCILHTRPIHWKIVVGYTTLGREHIFESAIMDLPWLVNGDSMAEERDTAYAKFLNQFENIRVRWGHHYEQLTEDIISSTADYQKQLCKLRVGTSGEQMRIHWCCSPSDVW
jgi:hypothetical protein